MHPLVSGNASSFSHFSIFWLVCRGMIASKFSRWVALKVVVAGRGSWRVGLTKSRKKVCRRPGWKGCHSQSWISGMQYRCLFLHLWIQNWIWNKSDGQWKLADIIYYLVFTQEVLGQDQQAMCMLQWSDSCSSEGHNRNLWVHPLWSFLYRPHQPLLLWLSLFTCRITYFKSN